ncbi:MAG: hypothetical protein WEE36_06545 [Acidimicrobiia bacterium]
MLIETMCLDVTTGQLIIPSDQVASKITEVLSALGINVVDEGCQATMKLSLNGSRRSATYYTVGVCWTGEAVAGETSLVVDREVRGTWTVDWPGDPPSGTQSCPAETDLIPTKSWSHWLVVTPLAEMFGYLGASAARGHFDVEWDQLGGPTPEDIQALTSEMSRDPNKVYFARVWSRIDPTALLPMVPYLIALLECRSCQTSSDWRDFRSNERQARAALEEITGESFAGPWSWWYWWEQNQ